MDTGSINYLAVGLAGIASFIFGAGWYGAFGRLWMRAAKITKADISGNKGIPPPVQFVLAIICQLVMAYMLAVFIAGLGGDPPQVMKSITVGAFVWLGFVATAIVVNYSFQSKPFMLSLIDGGHWLGVLIIQAAIIGWIGAAGL